MTETRDARRASDGESRLAQNLHGDRPRGGGAGVAVALFVALAALAAPARAAERFVCDCGAGADPQCVPGSDGATGTSPDAPWQSYDRAQDAWSGLAAGDSLRFCRGGVFPVAGSTQ